MIIIIQNYNFECKIRVNCVYKFPSYVTVTNTLHPHHQDKSIKARLHVSETCLSLETHKAHNTEHSLRGEHGSLVIK
jgi:hypothetical protein